MKIQAVLFVLFKHELRPKIVKLLLEANQYLSINEVTEKLNLHEEQFRSLVFQQLSKLEGANILAGDYRSGEKHKAIKIFKINPELPDEIKTEIERLAQYF